MAGRIENRHSWFFFQLVIKFPVNYFIDCHFYQSRRKERFITDNSGRQTNRYSQHIMNNLIECNLHEQ